MHCRYQYPVNFRRGEQYFKIGERTGFGKFAVLTAWDEYEGEHFSPVGGDRRTLCVRRLSAPDLLQ